MQGIEFESDNGLANIIKCKSIDYKKKRMIQDKYNKAEHTPIVKEDYIAVFRLMFITFWTKDWDKTWWVVH